MKTLMITAALVMSVSAYAGQWGGYPVIGFQLEYPSNANTTHFCQEGGNQVVSSPYIRQPIYTQKGFSWVAGLNHKSCTFGADAPSYDAVGTGIELDTCWIFDKCRK